MTRQQRFKYEMFVRVRDFGVAHAALFPHATKGGQAFAQVLAAVAAVDEQQKAHLFGLAEARRIKAATRDAVFDYMKTIAAAARRITQQDRAESLFVLPRKRRIGTELASARAFIMAASPRQVEFEAFGLPATFIADFTALVNQLQQAADVRLSSRTARRKAQAGIVAALAGGHDAARDLDVIVAIATRQQDPSTFAAWTAARQIEGQRDRGGKASAPAAAPEPAPEPVMPAPPASPASPVPPALATGSEPVPAMTSMVALEKAS